MTERSRVDDQDLYSLVGEKGFERLVAAFYRQVPSDPILGPMYPADDLDGAEQRLRDFLVGRFGGPPRYIEQRGHPRLRMRHMPFPIDLAARDRWLLLMGRALDEVQLPAHVDAMLRERVSDLMDVHIRVLTVLLDLPDHDPVDLPKGSNAIVVTGDLTPSLTLQLDREAIAAIADPTGPFALGALRVVAYDRDGVVLADPGQPDLVGRATLDRPGPDGGRLLDAVDQRTAPDRQVGACPDLRRQVRHARVQPHAYPDIHRIGRRAERPGAVRIRSPRQPGRHARRHVAQPQM